MKVKKQKTAMSLSGTINIIFLLVGIMFIGIIILGYMVFVSQQKLIKSNESRYESYLLADELRQSSDDLTRLARTYVITGDPKFEEYYFEVLDIRNGNRIRPESYERIYWDFVISEGEKPRSGTEKISLTDLMIEAGFSDEEFKMLAEAQKKSDALVNTEVIAMNAVKNIIDSELETLMLPGESIKNFAKRIMFDESYHEFKGNIMRPIDTFFQMLDARTKKNVDSQAAEQSMLLLTLGIFIVLMTITIIITFTRIYNKLKKSEMHLEDLVGERTVELQKSQDILKHAETQLVESEKMASLGSLVASVAHEINTSIGIGNTIATHIEDRTKKLIGIFDSGKLSQKGFKKYVNSTLESSNLLSVSMERATSLVKSFKQVAVDQSVEEKRVFNIKEYIQVILDSLHSKFKNNNYKVILECPEELTTYSYPGVFYQIITNLFANSMYHGFNDVDEGIISIEVKRNDNNIRIIFRDNGCGIEPENMDNIFEPFYTTRRGQGGSGLGLNIVYKLATETLNGTIVCTSTVGEGTQFVIELPMAEFD